MSTTTTQRAPALNSAEEALMREKTTDSDGMWSFSEVRRLLATLDAERARANAATERLDLARSDAACQIEGIKAELGAKGLEIIALEKESNAERARAKELEYKLADAAFNCPSCGRHDFGLFGPEIAHIRKAEAERDAERARADALEVSRWTTEKPTKSGWYWLKDFPLTGKVEIVQVSAPLDSYAYCEYGELAKMHNRCKWAGPILAPPETEK